MPRKAGKSNSTPEFVDKLREYHRAVMIKERVLRLSKHGSIGLDFVAKYEQLLAYVWSDVCRAASTRTDRCFVIRFDPNGENVEERVYSAITYRNTG